MEQFSTVALRSWLPRKSCKNFNSTTNDVTKMLTISVCRQCQSAVGDIQMWCMMMQLSVVPMDRPISLVRIYRNTRCCPLAFLSQVAWRPWYRFVRADDSQRQSCSLYKKYNDVIKLETVASMQGISLAQTGSFDNKNCSDQYTPTWSHRHAVQLTQNSICPLREQAQTTLVIVSPTHERYSSRNSCVLTRFLCISRASCLCSLLSFGVT